MADFFKKTFHKKFFMFFDHILKTALTIFSKLCMNVSIILQGLVSTSRSWGPVPPGDVENNDNDSNSSYNFFSKTFLTIFLKLCMMFTIDCRRKRTGLDFSKKIFFHKRFQGKTLFLMFFPIPQQWLTIFLKLCMIFTIDIRKKVTGPIFSILFIHTCQSSVRWRNSVRGK